MTKTVSMLHVVHDSKTIDSIIISAVNPEAMYLSTRLKTVLFCRAHYTTRWAQPMSAVTVV